MSFEKDIKNAFNGCGCFIMFICLAIVWKCGGCDQKVKQFWADRDRESQNEEYQANLTKQQEMDRARQLAEAKRKEAEAAEQANEAVRVAEELRKFAKEYVPNLQSAIDQYEESIKQFIEKRAVFAQEMNRQIPRIDPETRPAYKRQGEMIETMKRELQQLVQRRKETYIQWRELKLLGDTAETKKQMDALLQNAQDAAKTAEERFEKEMNRNLDGQ